MRHINMIMPKCIIWTRSTEEWPSDAALFAKRKLPVLHLPCITTRPLPMTVPLPPFAAALFTSIRGIQLCFADKAVATLVRGIPHLMTFGARSAAELEKLGLAVHRPLHIESSRELITYFKEKIAPTLASGARILAVGPVKPAFDVSHAIFDMGFDFTYLAVYETVPLLALSDAQRLDYQRSLAGVICFASPSAVQGFVEALMSAKMEGLGARLIAVAIGETTAHECRRHFSHVQLAAAQDIVSLVDKAQALLFGQA